MQATASTTHPESRLERFNASPLGKAYRGMILLCDTIASVMLAIFAIFVTVNVVGRFAFNKTYGATEELCTMMLLWLVTMGISGRQCLDSVLLGTVPSIAGRSGGQSG